MTNQKDNNQHDYATISAATLAKEKNEAIYLVKAAHGTVIFTKDQLDKSGLKEIGIVHPYSIEGELAKERIRNRRINSIRDDSRYQIVVNNLDAESARAILKAISKDTSVRCEELKFSEE